MGRDENAERFQNGTQISLSCLLETAPCAWTAVSKRVKDWLQNSINVGMQHRKRIKRTRVALVPTIEEECTVGCRCPSKDPAKPCYPITTHTTSRTRGCNTIALMHPEIVIEKLRANISNHAPLVMILKLQHGEK
jgi:hypothetical protein